MRTEVKSREINILGVDEEENKTVIEANNQGS